MRPIGARLKEVQPDKGGKNYATSTLKNRIGDWIFPKAPKAVIDAFVLDSAALNRAGITASRTRLAYALANVGHECDGFRIKNLTENINYTAGAVGYGLP